MIKIKFSRFLKLFLALTLALIFFPACDCWTTIDEILPDASEVCDWDGNYIYHLNIRAKTTGTEVEPLVPQVEYEGETYNLDIDENGERHFAFNRFNSADFEPLMTKVTRFLLHSSLD